MKSTQKASTPSAGGNIPVHKLVNGQNTEGTCLNYHKNVSQTPDPGNGKITERNLSTKPQVKKNQANANNDPSGRTKSTWGN